MQMLYNSDNFAVVAFEVPASEPASRAGETTGALTRGGYEIVDKFSRKEIYLEGAMAESFKAGVEALIQTSPSVEEIDAYIERFTSLMHQPVVLH
ncbi:MAG: DUF3567 domain-containing protein [Caldimonas sp.]|jgi:hypothetical protein|uniref:BTH_I0359 family protein n=1 Tax=Caldimonas sp. TaxID=2838790 RepID=UPI00391C3D2F